MDSISVSGVILSGGKNLRFGGSNKAFSRVGGVTILDRTLAAFGDLFQEIMVVTNSPEAYLAWDLLTVTDILPIRSPLSGIHAGLCYARTPYIFVTACDMPFLNACVIEAILKELDPKYDIIVPETDEGLQPLCALYSKQCLPIIERQLRTLMGAQNSEHVENRILDRGLKITALFEQVRVKKISGKKLRVSDPDLSSFFNTNTPEDFARAEQILSGKTKDLENNP